MLFNSRFITIFFIAFCLCSCETSSEKKVEVETGDVVVNTHSDSLNLVDTLTEPYKEGDKLTYEEAYDKALTLFEIPFIEKEVKTRFGNAHVIVSGPENGEPLVLLHGMNASSTMWYPNIKSYSAHYRVYAIDYFLEPGKSQYVGKTSNTDEIIDWYFEIFDQFHLKKFNLLGASRGGWLSVNIALRAKSRINKLILLSPAQTFGIIKPGLDMFSNVGYSMIPKRKNLRDILQTMSSNVDGMSQLFINHYYLATKKASIDANVIKMQPFFGKELKSLNMPILLLIGDKDIINGELNLNRAKRLCPNIQAEIISNAGHFLSMDQSVVVDKKVIEFLDKK